MCQRLLGGLLPDLDQGFSLWSHDVPGVKGQDKPDPSEGTRGPLHQHTVSHRFLKAGSRAK